MSNTQYEYSSETLVISGDLDSQVLIEFLKLSANNKNDTEKRIKTIIMNSGGGMTWIVSAMIDVINKNPDDYLIKVVNNAQSSSLWLLMGVNCKIEDIGGDFIGTANYMHHRATINGDQKKLHPFLKKNIKETNDSIFDKIKHVLTDSQKKLSKKKTNEKIYLSKEQVKELLGDKITFTNLT